jgi:hypothetical protein
MYIKTVNCALLLILMTSASHAKAGQGIRHVLRGRFPEGPRLPSPAETPLRYTEGTVHRGPRLRGAVRGARRP